MRMRKMDKGIVFKNFHSNSNSYQVKKISNFVDKLVKSTQL